MDSHNLQVPDQQSERVSSTDNNSYSIVQASRQDDAKSECLEGVAHMDDDFTRISAHSGQPKTVPSFFAAESIEQGLNFSTDAVGGPYGDRFTLNDTKVATSKKLGTFETFCAVLKAYCAINVLLLPRSFVNGGYLLSPIILVVACTFEATCAVSLCQIALHYGIYDYPKIAERAMGPKGRNLVRVLLIAAHFQFSVGQMNFVLQSLQSTVSSWCGLAESQYISLWVFGVVIFFMYTPLTWVRELSFFAKCFVAGVFIIIAAVIFTSSYAIAEIHDNDGEAGAGYEPINKTQYWNMIGFAFFMFEGIGCLMPVLKETEKPAQVPYLIVAALALLCTMYVGFSMLCYYAWGQGLQEPVVTEMLPAGNISVQILKLTFCLSLLCGYPLTAKPIFEGLEDFLLKEGAASDIAQKWKVNGLRTSLVIFTIIFSIMIAPSLDKVISLLGAVLGVTIVLMIPSYCHFKLLATTTRQKAIDMGIGAVALTMLIVGPVSITLSW